STIDLLVGNGIGDQQIEVPDLIGMTVSEARSYLSTNNIELGAIITMGDIGDTSNAYISKQKPSRFAENTETGEPIINKIRPGEIMDIWISTTPPLRDTADAQ
ncbi:MAG: PASTA domain-containing protein, partial [Panacibacter sp.]